MKQVILIGLLLGITSVSFAESYRVKVVSNEGTSVILIDKIVTGGEPVNFSAGNFTCFAKSIYGTKKVF